MKMDEVIDQSEFLMTENRALWERNKELLTQLHLFRAGLESAVNILDPEQIRIIQDDILITS